MGRQSFRRTVYRYITVDNSRVFIGEAAWHHDTEQDLWLIDVIIQKQHMDDPLVGDYQDTVSGRAYACVERRGDVYNIVVSWSDSTSEYDCWTMYGAVAENDRLSYAGEEIGHYMYDDEGNETTADVTMSNNLGWFEIKDSMLYWTGADQEECRAHVFEKIVYEE